MNKFWLVWHYDSMNAVGQSWSAERDAVLEAERLAAANPGRRYVVLEATKSRCCGDMQRLDLTVAEEDEIPF